MRQNWQWTVVFITGFRMFLQAILLERESYNACWLTPAVAFLIALPFLYLTANRWHQQKSVKLPYGSAGKLIRSIAIAYLLVDTAQIVLLYQEGTKFASLSTYPAAVLYLLLILFSLFVIRQNRNGVFGIGAALKSVLLIAFGMLIIFRLPDVRIARLAPVLGGGTGKLLLSSLSLTGYGFCFLIWLSHAPDIQPKTGTIIGMWATACAGAAFFSAMEVMISPVAPGEPSGLYLSVSRLLASGRSQTSIQLILYLAWFSLMFASVCLNLKCMAISLSELLRKKESWPVQIAVLLSTTALAIISEHMMGENLGAFLDIPGAFRAAFLLPMLLLLKSGNRKAVFS